MSAGYIDVSAWHDRSIIEDNGVQVRRTASTFMKKEEQEE